jgi:nicotinate-nucleotide pyrophosphorylase (carboxylating)
MPQRTNRSAKPAAQKLRRKTATQARAIPGCTGACRPVPLPNYRMTNDFEQIAWDDRLEDDCRQIVRLAIREDLDRGHDLTTLALVPEGIDESALVVARRPGIVAGMPAGRLALDEFDGRIEWQPLVADGDRFQAGTVIARIRGPARALLTAERTLLNLLGRLTGVATLTRTYVDAIAGTRARIYDTRKTTPGWRRLEKYAVRCGGGRNHRTGLFDAVLIKDNHLALGAAARAAEETPASRFSAAAAGASCESAADDASRESAASGAPSALRFRPADTVRMAREFLAQAAVWRAGRAPLVEVEVDTLEQLDEVLAAGPDIVLLDNMSPELLREAVRRRDAAVPRVELEASGGIQLDNVRLVALSGVDRISIGALTHSATSCDLALDWL